MKVLVTGASGFIGGNLVRELVSRGVDVRVLIRKSSNIEFISDLKIEKAYGDILDYNSLLEALKGVTHLYHVAALYKAWLPDPEEFYRVNVRGTVNVMRAALEKGVEKIVYTSSVAAVGFVRDGEGICDENCLWNLGFTEDHYTISKYQAEMEVFKMICRENLPAVIVNPAAPVGPGDWKPTPTGQLILQYLKKRIPAYADTSLSFVDVRDVVRGHILAMEKGKIGERYILTAENLHMKDVFEMLHRITGIKPPRVKTPYGVNYAFASFLEFIASITGMETPLARSYVRVTKGRMAYDNRKSIKELGLNYGPVEKALEDAVKWYREHGYVK